MTQWTFMNRQQSNFWVENTVTTVTQLTHHFSRTTDKNYQKFPEFPGQRESLINRFSVPVLSHHRNQFSADYYSQSAHNWTGHYIENIVFK